VILDERSVVDKIVVFILIHKLDVATVSSAWNCHSERGFRMGSRVEVPQQSLFIRLIALDIMAKSAGVSYISRIISFSRFSRRE
jgi:hypothetical protein